MRTLFISNTVGEELNSGCLKRVFCSLATLGRVSDVTFVAAAPLDNGRGSAGVLAGPCKEVHLYSQESYAGRHWEFDGTLAARRWKYARRLFGTAEPTLLQWYRSEEATRLVARLCAEPFDLVWVQRFYSLSLLPAGLKTRVVVDLDDLEHRKLRREISIAKRSWRTLVEYTEFVKLRRFERHLARLPYEFLVCSDADKRILGGGTNIHVVPNSVELAAYHEEAASEPTDPLITFTGAMDYAPNRDAVQFFAREVLPLVRREVPAAKFLIVGRNPRAEVLALDNGDAVRVTGTVPSVEPYLRHAAVIVAPLRVGGGTRIKILEAMAQCRPVVATTIGAEGLDAESGKHILIANSPSDLAAACVRLLRDPSLRCNLASNAYELVRTKYNWSSIQRTIEQIALRPPLDESRLETKRDVPAHA